MLMKIGSILLTVIQMKTKSLILVMTADETDQSSTQQDIDTTMKKMRTNQTVIIRIIILKGNTAHRGIEMSIIQDTLIVTENQRAIDIRIIPQSTITVDMIEETTQPKADT